MKLAMVVEIIVLCVVLTVFSIFTIDSVTVRKAELLETLSVGVSDTVEGYFNGGIETSELQGALVSTVSSSTSGKYLDISVTVFHASSEQGIVDFMLEATYEQPNGRPRTFSYKRVYIREKPSDPEAKVQYSFVRTIDAAHYKTAPDAFCPEEHGGLKADSIWKTDVYQSVLDSVLFGYN